MNNQNKYMKLALNEAKKALRKGEIPVGAVIVINDRIISKGHNLKDSTGIVTKHAEIIAIEKANKIIKDWRLTGAVIYVTLEPCPMCASAIQQSRISKIVYGASSNNKVCNEINKSILSNNFSNHKVEILKSSFLNKECEDILISFFKKVR